jgi:hypothetical protein
MRTHTHASTHSTRVVTARETLALAQELSTLIKGSVALYEVSALQGTNVVDAFQDTFLNVLRWRAGDKVSFLLSRPVCHDNDPA